MNVAVARFVDVTDQVCPMTFVRTKLALEKVAKGEVIEVRLNAGEPLKNVPRSAAEQGHQVLDIRREDPTLPEGQGIHRVRIKRG